MNKKSTKRALAMSLLSLVVCIAMLVGTTFAWFTDTVTSRNNIIKAGNLDIKLEYSTDNKTWADVQDATEIFPDDALWEPGYTRVVYFKTSNVGSLALKYEIDAVVYKEVVGKTKDGADIRLSEHLKFNVVDEDNLDLLKDRVSATGEATYDIIGDVIDLSGTFYGLVWGDYTNPSNTSSPFATEYSMDPGDETTVALVVTMPTTVGNEANHDGVNIPSISLGIELFATQYTSESDSFGNDYDKNAYLKTVTNAGELASALEIGGNIKLGGDIELAEALEVPAGVESVIDLNGNSIAYEAESGYAIYSQGDLTITGEGTIDTTSSNTYGIRIQSGSLVIDSADINVKGGFGAVSVFNGADVTINGGTFSNTGVAGKTSHVIYLGGYGTININGGTFTRGAAGDSGATVTGYGWENSANEKAIINITGGEFYSDFGKNGFISNYDSDWTEINITGGKYEFNPSAFVAEGHNVTENADGTYTVDREYIQVAPTEEEATAAENGETLAEAIENTTEASYIQLAEGEYKMPSIGGEKEVTIVGTKDTVIDVTLGAYMDDSTVAFEGVTIKGSTGKANGNGSDYAALYTPNVTYTNCTFDGPFRIGRDGATFINCKFTNLGNDYVWNMQNDTVFDGCTFDSDGKALLLYADGTYGTDGIANVVVKNCKFNATASAKAGAITNQPCAAIEIHNYGCAFNLTTENNTYSDNFSGQWRIKTYENKPANTVTVNGVAYTTTALDGKIMTVVNSEVTSIEQ